MVRVLLILTTFLLALPVMADDDKDEDRDGTSVRTECEQQANQKNLTGKDRRKFVKECAKEERHGGKDDKRHGEASRSDTSPSQAQSAQPAPQTKPAPAPAVTAPAQSAPAPAQPAAAPAPTPAAQPGHPGASRNSPGRETAGSENRTDPRAKAGSMHRRGKTGQRFDDAKKSFHG